MDAPAVTAVTQARTLLLEDQILHYIPLQDLLLWRTKGIPKINFSHSIRSAVI